MQAHFRRFGWLYAIVLAGAALRLVGIDFAPTVHRARPDEELFIQQALFLFSGDWNPHWAANGWPELYFFLTHLALRVKLAWLELTTGAPVNLGCLYVLDPVQLSVPARLVAWLFGVATIPLTYALARDALARHGAGLAHAAGLAAAAMLAFNVLHVRDSHFAVSDTTVVFFMTLGLWQLARHADGQSRRALYHAGLAFGVAISIKYTALAMLGMLALVGAARFFESAPSQRPRAAGALGLAFALAALAFVLTSPHVLDEPEQFWEGLKSHQVRYSDGGSTWGYEVGRQPIRGAVFHGLVSIPAAIGWPLWLLAIGGLARGLWRAQGGLLVIAFFALAFYAGVLGPSTILFMRYTQPLYPALAVLALVIPVELLATRGVAPTDRRFLAAAPLVVALALALPAWHAARSVALMREHDTRDLAHAWMTEHLAPGQTVLSQSSFLAVSTADAQAIEACSEALGPALARPAIPHGQHGNWRTWVEDGPRGWGPLVREFLSRSSDRGTLAADYVIQAQPQLACGHTVLFGRPSLLPDCWVEVARFAPGEASCDTLYDTFDMFMQPVLRPHAIERPGPIVVISKNECRP